MSAEDGGVRGERENDAREGEARDAEAEVAMERAGRAQRFAERCVGQRMAMDGTKAALRGRPG